MNTEGNHESYRPVNDLRLYPGIHLNKERREQLDKDEIDPTELTIDDIVFKLARLVTGTLYSLIQLIEERWGKQAARDLIYEWGRRRAHENLKRWMDARGLKKLTPQAWAKFQDYRHLISGPVHAPSLLHYEGDSEVILNRTGCLFHDGRPEGMDSYCGVSADGMFVGYTEVCPELKCEHPICKSRGTSPDERCQVRFRIDSKK